MTLHSDYIKVDAAYTHSKLEIGCWFKEYSLEARAELPQTKVADSQPSPRAGRPEGLVETLTCLEGRYEAHTDFTKAL